jgi:chromosome partitioning protein
LLYWGFHLFEGTKPPLAFKTVGRYSHPRMDFLKLVDYLEMQTELPKAKGFYAG